MFVRQGGHVVSALNRCYTCGKLAHWKELQCGHYIHGDNLDFELDNLRPQCPRCNKWLHGNGAIYAEKLVREIGIDRVERLRRLSKQVRKYTRDELEDLIRKYRLEVE